MAAETLRAAALCLVIGLLSAVPARAQSDAGKIRLIGKEAAGWSRNMERLLSSYTDDVSYEDPGMGLALKGKEQHIHQESVAALAIGCQFDQGPRRALGGDQFGSGKPKARRRGALVRSQQDVLEAPADRVQPGSLVAG